MSTRETIGRGAQQMVEAAPRLGLLQRAHVVTHQTVNDTGTILGRRGGQSFVRYHHLTGGQHGAKVLGEPRRAPVTDKRFTDGGQVRVIAWQPGQRPTEQCRRVLSRKAHRSVEPVRCQAATDGDQPQRGDSIGVIRQ